MKIILFSVLMLLAVTSMGTAFADGSLISVQTDNGIMMRGIQSSFQKSNHTDR